MSEPKPSENAPIFSDVQRKLLITAATLAAVAAIVVLICLAVVALGHLLSIFSNVLWPLAAAGIIALILRPCVDFLERRLKMRRILAVVTLYIAFVLVCFGLLLAILPPLIGQIIDLAGALPGLVKQAREQISQHYPQWIEFTKRQMQNPMVHDAVNSVASQGKDWLGQMLPSLKAAGGGILSVVGFATNLAIVPIYLFFFMLSRAEPTEKLGEHLPFLKPDLRKDVVFLAKEFVAIVVSFFRGQILIGLIMGVLFSVGYTIVGLKFGLFLGLLFGLLNIIPYLGTIIALAVTVPLALLQDGGGLSLLIQVLIVKVIVGCLESWVLTPKIMGDRTGLHPAAIIFALFFWGTALNGLLGMILAIPLTAFFVTVWRLAKLKYFTSRS